MLKTFISHLYSLATWVSNIGITDGLSFHEKKKTQLLNIALAGSIPVNSYFCIVNLIQGRPLLSLINMLTLLGSLLLLYINSIRKFLLARLVLTFIASILFTAGAILYRNGGEYFLIANLIVIMIYFSERTFLLLIGFANCLLFLGIKYYLYTHPQADPNAVSFGRVAFNTIWALATMFLSLLYFKREQETYLEQIEEKNLELEKLNETKQKLFSIIAHDLRSPIGQLKSSLNLVNKEHISPEIFKEISSKLAVEVDQLHITLDNLLNWSISQFQGIQVQPEKLSLKEMIDKKLLLFRQSIEKKNLQINTDGINHFVMADPEHLRLVIRNLLSNAIKFSYANGSIDIKAYLMDGRITIEIADKGIGMSSAVIQTLFLGEKMISKKGTSNEKGTGLGLRISKEFIEKNGGSLWFESEENLGSKFYISIPHAH